MYGVYKIVSNGIKKYYAWFNSKNDAKEYVKFMNLKELLKMSNDDAYYTSYIEIEQKYFIDDNLKD